MKYFNIRRLFAYFIDIMIVILISGLLKRVEFINPNLDKYNKTVDSYVEVYDELMHNPENGEATLSKIQDIAYDLNKNALSFSVIEAVVIILYFTFFPYFNHNQTIGQQLFGLKNIHLENKKVSLISYFLRSLICPISSGFILYNNLYTIASVFLLIFCSKSVFNVVNSIIMIFCLIFCYIDLFYCIINKDRLLLHDRITKITIDDKNI